jgi:hypothetical protein
MMVTLYKTTQGYISDQAGFIVTALRISHLDLCLDYGKNIITASVILPQTYEWELWTMDASIFPAVHLDLFWSTCETHPVSWSFQNQMFISLQTAPKSALLDLKQG